MLDNLFGPTSRGAAGLTLLKLPILLMLFAYLNACSTVKESRHTDDPILNAKLHTHTLQKFNRWQAKGKIKVSLDKDSHSASFDWQQYKNNYVIRVYGPFGLGTSWLRRTSKGVSFESPGNTTLQADSAEDLLDIALGWHAPISDMQYWVKGAASRKSKIDSKTTAPEGYLRELQQAGWDLDFNRHKRYYGLFLPGKITATRGNMRLLIIVKEWSR